MSAKLFLGGISPNTDQEVIREHFSKYGAIVDAVVMFKDGKHRGFGFVTFDSQDAALAVLAEEQVLDGRKVDVKQAVPPGEAPPPVGYGGYGGPPGVAGGAYMSYGQQPAPRMYGPMFGGGCAGGGFAGGGGDFAGGDLGRGPASRPSGTSSANKVFIGGLAQTTTDEMVNEYFSRYGTLVDAVVMKDRATQRSRGFGFVQYDSSEPVDQVMAAYKEHQLDGKWIEVKRAVPQDQIAPAPVMKGGYGGGFAGKGGPYGGGFAGKGGGKCFGGYGGGGAMQWGGPAYPRGPPAAFGHPAVGPPVASPAGFLDFNGYMPQGGVRPTPY